MTDSDCLADTNGSIAVSGPHWHAGKLRRQAGMDYHYPTGGATALTVRLTDLYDVPLESMTMPVRFEVYTNTKLLWDVSYDNSSSEHVFTGRLLRLNGTPVANQTVNVFLNETHVATLNTSDSGFIEYRRHFDSGTESLMYNVQATFEGTGAQQATLNAVTFDGTEYTVCTATCFQYKPSSNMTTVTIEPHATEVTVPVKSTEEMQQDATDSGWFSIYHEFSWWYPWYRMHVKMQVNPTIDIGFNPLLPGGETHDWSGLTLFANLGQQFVEQLIGDMLGLLVEYVLAKGFSIWNWPAAVITFAVKAVYQGLLMARDWYDSGKMLASALVNFLVGIIAISTTLAKAFLEACFSIVAAGTMSALWMLFRGALTVIEPIRHIRTWADGVEVAMDIGFGIFALVRHLGWI